MKLHASDLVRILEATGDAAKEIGVLIFVFGVVERTWSDSHSGPIAPTLALAVLPFVAGAIARDILAERLKARHDAPYVD